MICRKVPEVGARLAGGACAAAVVESASTIATNIASLVFIAVPRSGQPGELRVDRFAAKPLLVQVGQVFLVLVADRLQNVGVRLKQLSDLDRKWLRVHLGIVDGH